MSSQGPVGGGVADELAQVQIAVTEDVLPR